MKKSFFVKLICFFLALLVVPMGYFLAIQSLPAMFRGSLMGSIYVKQQLVEQTPGPRMLVIGGSSVPYSIECETVSEQIGMPCIAMGATAYLGIEYYLNLVDDFLHEGDVVVLAPEFAMLQNSVSYSTTWMAVENAPKLLKSLPLSYIPGMVSSYHTYAKQKIALWKEKGTPAMTQEEQYAAAGFGPWGDITFHREQLLESGYDKNNTLSLTEDSLSPQVVKVINQFAQKAEKAGATVLLTWAPFDALAYQGSPKTLQQFAETLQKKVQVPYVGDLKDCLMPAKFFYDSNNHLTSEGAQLRTQMLLRDLKR